MRNDIKRFFVAVLAVCGLAVSAALARCREGRDLNAMISLRSDEALAEAGRQARAAGNLPGACDRLYRASRSQWAQGLQAEAVRTLEEGVACAEELKDEAMGKRMAELFVTYKDGKRLTE